MSRFCPIYNQIVLYLDCLECEDKLCNNNIENNIIIGIDQSYKNTGITIIRNKTELLLLTSINFSNYKNNSEKRNKLKKELDNLIKKCKAKYDNAKITIVFERIRLQSQGFINIDYIKSIGALNAIIIDTAYNNNVKCYSVDTRCWKSQIVGSSKPLENKFGIDPEKYRTILYLKQKGLEEKILIKASKAKKKGVVEIDGERYIYNDDAADSYCIALFGFYGDKNKLEYEK